MADCRSCANYGRTLWCGGVFEHCRLTGDRITDGPVSCAAYEKREGKR